MRRNAKPLTLTEGCLAIRADILDAVAAAAASLRLPTASLERLATRAHGDRWAHRYSLEPRRQQDVPQTRPSPRKKAPPSPPPRPKSGQ